MTITERDDPAAPGPRAGPTLAILRRTAALASLGVLAAALYIPRLGIAPVHPGHDEVQFGRQAYSLATTGRDLADQRYPLYFSETEFPPGREPMSIYATAALLRGHRPSVSLMRLPTAIVGVIGVLLMFGLGRQVFKHDGLAWLTAAMLAVTPAYFMYSRVAMDVIYPLPFAIAWLWALHRYLERREGRWLVGAAASLSLGMYSYLVATMMLPLYFVMTVIAAARRGPARAYWLLAAGFCVPLVPLVIWEALHPARHTNLVAYYHLYDAQHLNVLQGAKDMASYFGLSVRVDTFWNCLNPGFLFFSGDSSVMNSTRLVGLFLLAMGILILAGIVHIWTDRRTAFNVLLLAALLIAPLPSALTVEVATRRVILMVPLAVLVGAYGVECLARHRSRFAPALCVVLVATMPFQFAHFYRDYMGDYRARSAPWFGGNILGGMDAIIDLETDGRPPLYLSKSIYYVDQYWPFALAARGREDLAARTRFIDGGRENPNGLPGGTLLMAAVGEPLDAAARRGEWRALESITEPGGAASFVIYEHK